MNLIFKTAPSDKGLPLRGWHGVKTGLAEMVRPAFGRTCFVGVTGSCGKTTTVELLSAVLARAGRVRKGTGATNPAHRVAGTILSTPPWFRFIVHELGGFEPGVLAETTALMKPRVGVVTAVANDHYSAFKGPDGVAREKATLVRSLPDDGLAVLNADDERVLGMRAFTRARVITFGVSDRAAVRAEAVSSAWPDPLMLTVVRGDTRVRVKTRLYGEQWTSAVLAALAAGWALGIPLEEGVRAIGETPPVEGRMSPHPVSGGITFIQDTWKSPLYSIPLVLRFLEQARVRRKIVVIGSLSDYSGKANPKYRDVGRQAAAVADKVLFVGRWAHYGLKGRAHPDDDRIQAFPNLYWANRYLADYLAPGDLVMLKGSNRNDHFERIVMDRTTGIACWRADCRRRMQCRNCRFRNRAFSPVEGAGG